MVASGTRLDPRNHEFINCTPGLQTNKPKLELNHEFLGTMSGAQGPFMIDQNLMVQPYVRNTEHYSPFHLAVLRAFVQVFDPRGQFLPGRL